MSGKSLVAAVAVLIVVAMSVLAPQLAGTALEVAHNDRLHYVVHLAAGQTLGLCPCTQDLAQTQVAKGLYHAHTPRQVALLTRSPADLVRGAVRHFVG